MPYRPKTPCKHFNCPKTVPYGEKFCGEHKSLHPERIRSAVKRGYNYKWQKASKQFLKENPLCIKCLAGGKYTEATVVDHIKPHRNNQELFWDRNNWQALCKRCHDKKTGSEDSRPTYSY